MALLVNQMDDSSYGTKPLRSIVFESDVDYNDFYDDSFAKIINIIIIL